MPIRNMKTTVLDYQEVLDKLRPQTPRLLLGNGFSISCDPIFSYPSLYDAAVKHGLSKQAQEIFQWLGTNDFEGVLHLLDNASRVLEIYSLVKEGSSPMRDRTVIKQALIEALAKSHLDQPGMIDDQRKRNALDFLKPYHSIFTTNYDLLLYWTVMFGKGAFEKGAPQFPDGFGNDLDHSEKTYVVYTNQFMNVEDSRRGLYYLHGALHLFILDDNQNQIYKQCWNRSKVPLIKMVRDGLDKNQYPLFVAEGDWEQKLRQICSNSYLYDCLNRFRCIKAPLVIFGHSLAVCRRRATGRGTVVD